MGDFSENISIIVNSILLSLIYFVGVGLTAIFAKVVKKSFLDTKISNKKSYWTSLNLKRRSKSDYYRQF